MQNTDRKIVLFIDDDEVFHFIIRDFMLSNYPNIEVSYALSTAVAIDQLPQSGESNYPQLIICKLEMATFDKAIFLKRLQDLQSTKGQHTPVVLLTHIGREQLIDIATTFQFVKDVFLKSNIESKMPKIMSKYLYPPCDYSG